MNGRFLSAECRRRVDLVFIVDSSGSIQEEDPNGWNSVKSLIIGVINRFTIGLDETRVGLTEFGEFASAGLNDPHVPENYTGFFFLHTYDKVENITAAVSRLYYMNSLTNTAAGLRVAHDIIFQPPGDRPDVPNLAVVITDGVSNINKDLLPEEARLLKNVSTVIVIGVTSNVNFAELTLIATDVHLITAVPNFASLNSELENIIDQMCSAVIETPVETCKLVSMINFKTN